MPTVIDALIVKLGLDSKDLDAKTPAATKKIKDVEAAGDKTEKTFKKLKPAAQDASRGFESLTRSVGAFLALLGGSVALKAFVEDTIATNAALERLSLNLNLEVSTLSAWGNAVEQMGGSSKGLQGSLEGLSRAQQEFILTGNSSIVPYLSALNVAIVGVGLKARPVTDILLDLADKVHGYDRPMANNLLRSIGLDQDTANLVLRGRREIELTISRQKEYTAVTKAQADEAVKLQRAIIDLKQQFTAFGRDLLQQAAPALEKLLGLFQNVASWAIGNREFLSDFAAGLGAIATGLGLIALASSPLALTAAAVVALAAAIALLWQDYQTWKRGGDSFIDWGVWEKRVNAVTSAIKVLRGEVKGLLEDSAGKLDKLLNKIPGYSKLDKAFTSHQGADKVRSAIGGALGINAGSDPQKMQKYFQDRGWTAAQAAGIVANLIRESKGNPNATGDNGKAYGIAQWHPDRQAAFKKFAGHDITQSTQEEQMAFVHYEMTQGTEKAAGDALRKTTTAEEAGAAVSRGYERPADAAGEAQRRGDLARQLMGVQGAAALIAHAGQSSSSLQTQEIDRSVTIDTINIHTMATDADGIAKDLGHSMNYLHTSQANSGLN